MTMPSVEELLQATRRLSNTERRRLVEALEEDLREEPIAERRRDAISGWVALAGRFHAAFTDVSSDKYN